MEAGAVELDELHADKLERAHALLHGFGNAVELAPDLVVDIGVVECGGESVCDMLVVACALAYTIEVEPILLEAGRGADERLEGRNWGLRLDKYGRARSNWHEAAGGGEH